MRGRTMAAGDSKKATGLTACQKARRPYSAPRVATCLQRRPAARHTLRWHGAIHEASHAIVATALGRVVLRVTLSRGRNPTGTTTLRTLHRQEHQSEDQQIAILVAGAMGEQLLAGTVVEAGLGADAEMLGEALAGLSPTGRGWARQRDHGLRTAAAILLRHGETVLRLAEELYRSGRLHRNTCGVVRQKVRADGPDGLRRPPLGFTRRVHSKAYSVPRRWIASAQS